VQLSGAMLAVLAANSAAPPPREATGLASISYEKTACYGVCPVFVATLRSDGTGTFDGKQFTVARGPTPFRVAPATFRALAATLAPLRPRHGTVVYDPMNCRGLGAPVTDASSTRIVWRGANGRLASLAFYDGCPAKAVTDRLAAARALLPLDRFIGRPDRRRR
jgi:NAD-dependent dihydropyrimidine dehydrogenase PreA subunit